MFALGLVGLLACGDKETEDTASVEDTAVSETDVEDTGTTEDTDTTVEDTADTNETEEPLDSEFPDLLTAFLERIDAALPAPILDDNPDNTTTMALAMMSFSPVFEIQMQASDPNVTVTCPSIEGEFPEDGLPTEPVVVTGNGCVNEMGATYNGSFVYSENGIVYSDYSIAYPVEGCEGVSMTAHYNGGTFVELGFTGISLESMFQVSNQEVDEVTCTPSPVEFQYHLDSRIDFQPGDAQLINGHADILVVIEGQDYAFSVDTQDEVVNEGVCPSEPLSGTNTLSNGVDEAVFTFDGATDCDEEPTQMLSVNGGEAVEVSGASCSSMSSTSTMTWMVGLMSLLGLRRRF